jgi:hypothetical protein
MRESIGSRKIVVGICTAALGAGLSAPLGGCAPGRTFVLEPATSTPSLMSVAFERDHSTVQVQEDVAQSFERRLETRFKGKVDIEAPESADLVLRYRFVLYDTGSAATRLGSGVAGVLGSPFYGLGDGSIGVEVAFVDRDGRHVGRILVDGALSGVFGTSEGALDTAASSVAQYTLGHFLASPVGVAEGSVTASR